MKDSFKRLFNSLTNWKENKDITKWLYSIGRNYKRYVFGFLFINFITMIISLASSIVGRYVVDSATNYKPDLFYKYIIIMFCTTIVSIIISAFSNMFSSYVNEKMAFGVRAEMFDNIQRSEWYKLSKYHSGDMLARLSSDIDNISSTLITLLPNIIVTGIQLILVLIILFINDPVLACIGLVVGPVGMIASILFRKKYSEYQKRLKESQSEYYSFFQESLSKIGVIKTFQLEDENNEKFSDIRNRRMKLVMKSSALASGMSSAMRLIYSIGYVVTFSWCAYRLTTATIDANGVASFTYGTMTLFLSLVSQVQASIRSLGHIIPRFYSLKISSQRIREISEIENENYDNNYSTPKKVALKAKGVQFSYETDEGNVLSDFTFDIPACSRVGIVGTSGTGKTTFIRLLLSLIKPDKGELLYVDENNNEEVACTSSRRFISYVPQGNTLMSGTIRDNLLLGNKNATEEEIWEALRNADAEKFIKNAQNGLDTTLSERAGGISEGQAQRIAIARALLRNKPVLILDEATSALDEKTEANIFESITKKRDTTYFIITHRRSMLRYCDYILEITDDGNAILSKNSL